MLRSKGRKETGDGVSEERGISSRAETIAAGNRQDVGRLRGVVFDLRAQLAKVAAQVQAVARVPAAPDTRENLNWR